MPASESCRASPLWLGETAQGHPHALVPCPPNACSGRLGLDPEIRPYMCNNQVHLTRRILLVVITGSLALVRAFATIAGRSTISRSVPVLCIARGSIFTRRRITLASAIARERSLWRIVLTADLCLRRPILARPVRSSGVIRPVTLLIGLLVLIALARRRPTWIIRSVSTDNIVPSMHAPEWRIVTPILVRTLCVSLTRMWSRVKWERASKNRHRKQNNGLTQSAHRAGRTHFGDLGALHNHRLQKPASR